MEKEIKSPPQSFWEIQKKQQRISVVFFLLLLIFYLLTVGLICGAVFLTIGLLLPGFNLARNIFPQYAAIVFLISAILTFINFSQARKNGVNYLLKNLRAYSPDPEDRYHLTFLNVVDEMKIASGYNEIKAYVIPSLNLNSLSLLKQNQIPAIVVTEGLLAEASRDELQAVIAHETAHIVNGDTFLLTLVCSIAAFYQQLVDSLESGDEITKADSLRTSSGKKTAQPVVYLAGIFSFLLLNFFIALISQKRELLADAKAVEFSRDPLALARIIYKAHISNSYLGDTSLFTPLFLVPPDSRNIQETTRDKLFNTHPPVAFRLKLLSQMAHKSLEEVIEEIKAREELREKLRLKYTSLGENFPDWQEKIKDLQLQVRKDLQKEQVWLVKNTRGQWEGPYVLGSLITLPFFTPAMKVKNIQENLEGRAGDFPQIRFALYRHFHNQPVDPARQQKCPVCQTELTQSLYEGIKIKKCSTCHGKLVPMADLEKVFARKELSFSDSLKQKAEDYLKAFLDPAIKVPMSENKPAALCPECGLQFLLKPFSYHYLLPVYKCYHCQQIWFEDQELEIIQILIEEKARARALESRPS